MTTTAVYKILKKDIERGPRGFPGPGGPAGGTFIHSELNNLDYATAGHTGFATAAQGALADAALPAANYTAADVLAKLLTVDGTGSLLDADKLDGQEGAWYAPIDSPEFTTLVSLTGATNPNYRVTDSTNSVITKLQSLDLQGLVGTESNHDFQIRTNNVIVALFDTDGNVQEPNFTAGFAAAGGTNWQITAAGDASFDDLLVRGSARFRELIIDQLSVIGGSTLQSAARGKIASINVGDSTVTLEDPYDNGVCAFESDDFFWSKNVDIDNSTAVTDCQGQITNVTGLVLTLDFGVADANGAIGDLSVGDILVQRGNEDDSSGAEDRQNLIYTTVSDADAPFRRVLSGIDSLAAFTDLDNVVLQDGNLENLAGHDIVPVNPGYGLYSSNVYLSGKIVATEGAVGGFVIDADAIYSGVKHDADNYAASAGDMTLNEDGSFHTSTFYINADGIVGISQAQPHWVPKVAGTTVRNSHDAIANDLVYFYKKIKTITLPNGLNGVVRVYFDLASETGGDIVYGKVYHNGVAVGAEHTSTNTGYTTFNDVLTIDWGLGDTCELWIQCGVVGTSVYVKNFRIAYDDGTPIVAVTSINS